MSVFTPATKLALPVKIGLVGPSGSGKTYTALRMGRGLAGPRGRIALIDTEHGSALEYSDQFRFDHAPLEQPYSPARYVELMRTAEHEGYDVLVVDGLSPAWAGPGGVQEIVDKNTKGGNSWSGWAVGTPAHQSLLEAILACKIHLICTMRAKSAWALEVRNGKQVPVKVGLEPIQRDGIDYEFTIVGHLDLEHNLTVTKSRRQAVPVGVVVNEPGENVGARLAAMVREVEEEILKPSEPEQGSLAQRAGVSEEAAKRNPELAAAIASEDPLAPPSANGQSGAPASFGADGSITLAQIEQLDKLATELSELSPNTSWTEKIKSAALKDYGCEVPQMTEEQTAKILERLTTTLLSMRAEAVG